MNNEQTARFYDDFKAALVKWAAETRPEDCRIVGNKVVAKTYGDLHTAIGQVFIKHQIPERFGVLLVVAATASLIACYGRMDTDEFLSDLTEIVSISMTVAHNVERMWVETNGEADRAAQDAGEKPTIH